MGLVKKALAAPASTSNGKGKHMAKASPPTQAKIHDLSLAQIMDDTDLQPRRQMDLDVMREYTNAWLEGSKFPPVDIFFDGEHYWLADGFYRVRSARAARLTSIRARVHDGSKRDALLFALSANEEHGLRRTNDDRKKAVIICLNDADWCQWSDSEIARACKVSSGFVSNLRRHSPSLRGHDIGARIGKDGRIINVPEEKLPEGVDHKTFQRPGVLMTRSEIIEKYEKRLFRHIKKTDTDAQRQLPYKFGMIEIGSPTALYAIVLVTDKHSLYSVVGRMLVARAVLNSKADIIVVGHFPRSIAPVIQLLADQFGIQCRTPEQILSS